MKMMFKTPMQIHLIGFIIIHITNQIGCLDPGDDGRPYEFGFTIDGEQHRHESRDIKGIVQGEFGFITGDGVYHVTVYATDENGNFRILSMKNIKVSEPLDQLEGKSKPKVLPTIHQRNDVEIVQETPQNTKRSQALIQEEKQQNHVELTEQAPPITSFDDSVQERHQNYEESPKNVKEELTTIRAPVTFLFTTKPTLRPGCGGCGIPFSTTKKPQRMQFQTPEFQKPMNDNDFHAENVDVTQRNLNVPQVTSSFPQNNKDFIQRNEDFTQRNEDFTQKNEDFTQRNKEFSQTNNGFIQRNEDFTQRNEDFSQKNEDFTQRNKQFSQTNNGFIQRNEDFTQRNEDFSQKNDGFTQRNQDISQRNDGFTQRNDGFPNINERYDQSNDGLNDGTLQRNQGFPQRNENSVKGNINDPNKNVNLPGRNSNGFSEINNEDFTTRHSDISVGHNEQITGGNDERFVSGNVNTYPGRNSGYSGENSGFTGGDDSFPGVKHSSLPGENNRGFPNGNNQGFPKGNNGDFHDNNSGFTGGKDGNYKQNQKDVEFVNLGIENNPLSNDKSQSSRLQTNPSGSFPRDQTDLQKVTIDNTDGQIIVPNNPSIKIQDKYPNMLNGLPEGIEEKDVLDLLYKFNYTFNFHGHYEKGYKDGTKIGGYFVNGRDGISRVVTYIADERGYRPKFKLINLGLESSETPKEATEKTFTLKSFEFVWYPIS